MSHVLATVLHRGHKAASNVMASCPASSRGSSFPEHGHGDGAGNGIQLLRYDAPFTSIMVPVENSEPSEARKRTA